MALNLKNREVERLAAELARSTGQSMTAVVLQALQAQKASVEQQLRRNAGARNLRGFLEQEVWNQPIVDAHTSEEEILGYEDET